VAQYYYYYISYPEAQKVLEVLEYILGTDQRKEVKEAARRVKKEIEMVRPDVKYKFGGYQATISGRDAAFFENLLDMCQVAIQRIERGEGVD